MLRVAWLTNNAAPYRRSMWEYLGSRSRLRVEVLESDRALRRRARRGVEWTIASAQEESTRYEIGHLASFAIGRGERLFHTALRSTLKRPVPDAYLIGGWDSPAYWQALIAARLRRVRTVGFYESTASSQRHATGVVAALRAYFFRQLDAVVVPGAAARDAVREMGVADERIYVGFNSVDVAAFARPRHVAESDGAGHNFVYVGQLIERKNVSDLIHAFAEVRNPDDYLTIVGTGTQEDELRGLVDALQLADRVHFEGAVAYAELPALLWGQETLVLPSREEVWGLVVNEALAAGLHVVVADSAGVAVSVSSHEGVYVAAPTVDKLAAAMRASRQSWVGPIRDPEILNQTPERFAEVFLDALRPSPGPRNSILQ